MVINVVMVMTYVGLFCFYCLEAIIAVGLYSCTSQLNSLAGRQLIASYIIFYGAIHMYSVKCMLLQSKKKKCGKHNAAHYL